MTALAPMLFGTTYLVVTSQLLPQGRPLLLAAVRVLPASLVLLAIARPRLSARSVRLALAIGALAMGPYLAAFFIATDRLPNGVAATISNTTPIFVVALSTMLLGERPSPSRGAAAIAAVVGVSLLLGATTVGLNAAGVVCGFLSALLLAIALLGTRRWTAREDRPIDTAAVQLLGAGIVLAGLAALFERGPVVLDSDFLLGAAVLSVALTAVPFVFLYAGIAKIGPARVSLLAPITPVVATVLGIAFRSERLSAGQVVGLLIVLAAIVVAQLPDRRVAPAQT